MTAGAPAYLPGPVRYLSSKFHNFVESRAFQNLALLVIVFASILIGIETNPSYANLDVMSKLEEFITYFFLAEVILKMLAVVVPHYYFFHKGDFKRPNLWNWFDVAIVILCLLQLRAVAVVRLFRLLRVLKLVKAVPTLRMLLSGLMASLGSIGYILLLLLLLFYVFSIIGMVLYQDKDNNHFGSVPISMVTLFAISTGGSWTAVMYNVIFDCGDNTNYPECTNQTGLSWVGVAYFGVFVLLSSMVLLNLVIGVITQSMDTARKDNIHEQESTIEGLNEKPPPTGIKKVVIDTLLKLRLMAPPKVEKKEVIAFKRGQQGILKALDAHIELVSRLRITVVNLQKRRDMMKKKQALNMAGIGYCPYRDGIRKLDPRAPGMKYPYYRFTNFFAHIANSSIFQTFTLLIVLLAAVLVGLQADSSTDSNIVYSSLEQVVKWVFLGELVIKTLACGEKPFMYFFTTIFPVLSFDFWNLLDLVVVVASFLEIQEIAILRLFRLIRILKLVRAIPTLRNLLVGLIKSLGSMVYVFLLLLLLFYIFGILGILIFRDNDPVHFQSLGLAFLSLFQCATGDDWTDILYINMRGCKEWIINGYPADRCTNSSSQSLLSIIYFVIFMLLSAMVTLNLVIGVINSSMEETQEELKSEKELAMMNIMDGNGEQQPLLSNASHTQVTQIMSNLLKLQDNQLRSLLDKHLLGKKVENNPENLGLARPINSVDPLMFKPPREQRASTSPAKARQQSSLPPMITPITPVALNGQHRPPPIPVPSIAGIHEGVKSVSANIAPNPSVVDISDIGGGDDAILGSEFHDEFNLDDSIVSHHNGDDDDYDDDKIKHGNNNNNNNNHNNNNNDKDRSFLSHSFEEMGSGIFDGVQGTITSWFQPVGTIFGSRASESNTSQIEMTNNKK